MEYAHKSTQYSIIYNVLTQSDVARLLSWRESYFKSLVNCATALFLTPTVTAGMIIGCRYTWGTGTSWLKLANFKGP